MATWGVLVGGDGAVSGCGGCGGCGGCSGGGGGEETVDAVTIAFMKPGSSSLLVPSAFVQKKPPMLPLCRSRSSAPPAFPSASAQ
jgi:hypothetical protein